MKSKQASQIYASSSSIQVLNVTQRHAENGTFIPSIENLENIDNTKPFQMKFHGDYPIHNRSYSLCGIQAQFDHLDEKRILKFEEH